MRMKMEELIAMVKRDYTEKEIAQIVKSLTVKKVPKVKATNDLDLLKLVAKENRIRPAIGNVLCSPEGKMMVTDLDVTLIIDNGNNSTGIFSIEQLKANFTEQSLFDVEDYPVIRKIEGVEYKLSNMKSALENTLFATDKSGDNLSLNCIRINQKNNTTKFMGTDSFRFITNEYENVTDDFEVSIPYNTCKLLIKALTDEEVNITIADNKIQFEQGNKTIISRTIELPYPNIDIYTFNFGKSIEVSYDKFTSALKEITEIGKNSINKHQFKLDAKNGIAKLSVVSERIKKDYEMEYIGDEIKASLNSKFILEYLSTVDLDSVKIEFNKCDSAFKINNYIFMPLALED